MTTRTDCHIKTTRRATDPVTAEGKLRLAAAEAEWKRVAAADTAEGYAEAHAALFRELRAAYGADAPAVYDVMLDSWESAEYAAAHVVRCRAEEARLDASQAWADAAWLSVMADLSTAGLSMTAAHRVASEAWAEHVAFDAEGSVDDVLTVVLPPEVRHALSMA